MNEASNQTPHLSILFFDGVCVLCNGFADFILKQDRGRTLHLASLQGETAAAMLPEEMRTHMQSVIFVHQGKTYTQSEAVIRILMQMGGFYSIAMILLIVPSFLSNAMYRYISRNRYAWFGKRASCRMPVPEEMNRFLK
jgi:predicted DCC family thiol-disulfide oxidoreductase YuxK